MLLYDVPPNFSPNKIFLGKILSLRWWTINTREDKENNQILCTQLYLAQCHVLRHYGGVVNTWDSNHDYLILFEGAGSNPAGVEVDLFSM